MVRSRSRIPTASNRSTAYREFGEWTVIEYDAEDGILDEYDNFLEFLKDTADTVRLMAGGWR